MSPVNKISELKINLFKQALNQNASKQSEILENVIEGEPRDFSLEGCQAIGGSKRGTRDASPTGVQIISFSGSFWQNVCKIIPLWKLAPPRKILDPPLQPQRGC